MIGHGLRDLTESRLLRFKSLPFNLTIRFRFNTYNSQSKLDKVLLIHDCFANFFLLEHLV